MITSTLPLLLLLAAEIPNPAAPPVFRQPQLAAAHGKVVMTYGSESTVWFASSPDGGASFSRPVKVADFDGHLGMHRGPRIVVTPDAIAIGAVGKTAGDLVIWRSTDSGARWTRSGVANDVPGSAIEGLQAIAADSKGNLFAVWLDDRQVGSGPKVKRLFGARSADGGVTWAKNVMIYSSPDGAICPCCDPSVAFDEKGEVWAMWRNALGGSRDMYVAHSSDGIHFSAAQKLGDGTWKLDACPMDGGALAIDHGKPVSAWRRGTGIFIDLAGQPESQVGEGKDVSMAVGKGGAWVAWSNPKGIQIYAPGSTVPKRIANSGAFPNLISLPGGAILAAWEDKGAIRTERLP